MNGLQTQQPVGSQFTLSSNNAGELQLEVVEQAPVPPPFQTGLLLLANDLEIFIVEQEVGVLTGEDVAVSLQGCVGVIATWNVLPTGSGTDLILLATPPIIDSGHIRVRFLPTATSEVAFTAHVNLWGIVAPSL